MNFSIYEDQGKLQIVDQDALGEVIATMDWTLPAAKMLRLARLLAAAPRLAIVCREVAADRSRVLDVEWQKKLIAALHFAGQDVSPCSAEAVRNRAHL